MRSGTSSSDEADCPDAGDFIWLTFDPQAGREHAGRRPALVLSPMKYNLITRLCVACPVTTRIKNYPFEVRIPDGASVAGVVLADQVKSISWHARGAQLIGTAPDAVVDQVRAKVKALLAIR